MKNENISAFAFNTGRKIEEFIKEENDNLVEKNQLLEARVLQWRTKMKEKLMDVYKEDFLETAISEYDAFFGIETSRGGKI